MSKCALHCSSSCPEGTADLLLPSLSPAHSFNQLDLPAYETYDKLRTMLLKAIQECTEGFGFA